MLKYILSTLSIIAVAINSIYAQQPVRIIENDSLLKVYLSKSSFGIDSDAHAIILFEKGTADIDIKDWNSNFSQTLIYKIERCIKINNHQALDVAEIAIPYAPGLKAKDIEIMSINIKNGLLIKEKIKKPDILKEKLAGGMKIYKFNLPNIKVGSIIYYTYTYQLDVSDLGNSLFFPLKWDFNGKYPTLDSRFEIYIPTEINHKIILRNTAFTRVHLRDSIEKHKEAFFTLTEMKSVPKDIFLWKKSDLPAISEEQYSIENHNENVTVYISGFVGNRIRTTIKIPDTWEQANERYFYQNSYLGKWIFKPDDTLSIVLNKIVKGETDNLRYAKSIYRYVRDSFTCKKSDYSSIWKSQPTKDFLRKKVGTPADKNILLTSLFRKAGFKSFPVLISTTGNYKIDPDNFDPTLINYLVTALIVEDKLYYLDASSKHLPFGTIKPECYNGSGWLVNEKGILVSMHADNLTDKNICMASLKPAGGKGIFHLKMDQKMGNISGPMIRALWEKDSVETKKFLDNDIQSLNYKIKIIDRSIANISNPDTSLIISYDLELELNESGNYFYLNPFFKPHIENNPFKDVTRKYPVEFPNAINSLFILKFTLPDGYVVEDIEGPASLNLKNGLIRYNRSMLYDPNQGIFSLSNSLNSNTTNVSVEDYKELRSLYEAIVSDQNKSIVLKKIN